MSPYVDYTDRWLSLAPKHLAELFPDFLSELQYDNITCFIAPCGGGIIVALNNKLPLMITCRQELFPALYQAVPTSKKETITDTEFAKQLFKGIITQELFERSGVNALRIEPITEPPPKVTLSINLTASLANTVDIAGIRTKLNKKIQKLIKESGLDEVKLDLSVTASKSTNQFVTEFVVGKNMMKLAQLFLEKHSYEQ